MQYQGGNVMKRVEVKKLFRRAYIKKLFEYAMEKNIIRKDIDYEALSYFVWCVLQLDTRRVVLAGEDDGIRIGVSLILSFLECYGTLNMHFDNLSCI